MKAQQRFPLVDGMKSFWAKEMKIFISISVALK